MGRRTAAVRAAGAVAAALALSGARAAAGEPAGPWVGEIQRTFNVERARHDERTRTWYAQTAEPAGRTVEFRLVLLRATAAGAPEGEASAALQKAAGVVRRRLDLVELKGATVGAQEPDRLVVRVPGLDATRAPRVLSLVRRAGAVEFRLVATDAEANNAEVAGKVPDGFEWLPARPWTGNAPARARLLCRKEAALTADDLEGAEAQPQLSFTSQGFDQHPLGGIPYAVRARLGPAAGKRFGAFTREHRNRRVAAVVDGGIVSAPVVRDVIDLFVIVDSLLEWEARELAVTLRSGRFAGQLDAAAGGEEPK